MHDQNGESTFQWLVEKEQATFLNWASSQPNNYGGQDCAGIGRSGLPAGEWNDQTCAITVSFICEMGQTGSGDSKLYITFYCDNLT